MMQSSAESRIPASRASRSCASLLCAAPLDELADLAANSLHRGEKLGVRLSRVARQELDRTPDPTRAADREAEGGVQTGVAAAARERGSSDRRAHRRSKPAGRSTRRAARQASPHRKHSAPAFLRERGQPLVVAIPGFGAPQEVPRLRKLLPDRSELPAERGRDRLEDLRVRLGCEGRLAEDQRNSVLGCDEPCRRLALRGSRMSSRSRRPALSRRW